MTRKPSYLRLGVAAVAGGAVVAASLSSPGGRPGRNSEDGA
jgi:hypothetical protein